MSTLTRCAVAIVFGMAVTGCSNMNGGYGAGYSTTPRSPQLEMPYPTSPTAPTATQSGAADKSEDSGQAVPGPTK